MIGAEIFYLFADFCETLELCISYSLLHYVISDNCKLIAALHQMSLFVLCYNIKIMLYLSQLIFAKYLSFTSSSVTYWP